MLTLGSQRDLFDIPADVAYFNTAYSSPLLTASRDRLVAAASAKGHPWERTPDDFFADAEAIRRLAGDLFGGDADGYAIVPAASYGISSAARAIEPSLRPGDRLVVLDDEFPSNVLPWRRVARETGSRLITVPRPTDGDWTRATLTEITRGVKVVALSNCHWTNGALVDLEEIGVACRAVGAVFVLDATQSLGAVPLDLASIQPDFLVAAGYKWLLCPYGFGLMYVGPRWRDARPLEESWLARRGADDFASLANYSDEYMAGARRFDVGEKCTAILPGAIAALEQLKAWTIPEIAASLGELNRAVADRLVGYGFRIPEEPYRAPHLFGALLPDGYEGNLIGALRAQRIYVSQRGSSTRFAPHLHVTGNDVDRLFGVLDKEFSRYS